MVKYIKKSFTKGISLIKRKTSAPLKKIKIFIKAHPFKTLFSLLGLLVLLIVISNFLQRPPAETQEVTTKPKKVDVYRIGEAPKVHVQAQIEKSGVVTITALAPGVVQQIYAEPGMQVAKGTTLLSTSTNYQGGNAAALQASIADRQLQNINETYDIQKDVIQKQKDIANKTDENADQMRDITNKSIEETKGLISLNNEILDSINDSITGSTTPSEISGLKQLKSQFLSANNQLNSALRNAEYNAAADKPAAQLSDLQREMMIKQFEVQEKALDLNRDVTRLQYQAAQVQAAVMAPSSPFNAVVQRVNVKVGEAVNPGTPLIILSQAIEEDPIVAIAYVPKEIAQKVSYLEPSILSIGDFTYEAYPSYVTQDAISGNLYGMYFPIPDNYHGQLTNNGYINVQLPVGYFDTGIVLPYVPIDSIYQTENEAFVFVAVKGKAESKKIELGNVLGRFVEVTSGLEKGDVIILDRNVISGDSVTIQ